MRSLRKKLSDHYRKPAALLFSRGSAGIYAMLAALRESRGPGEVILPSICCETVLMAIRYAGMTPVVADVDPGTLCLSERTVRDKLSDRTRAVILVYAFGNAVDPDQFQGIRRRRQLLFVEDLALAVGASFAGRRLGTTGDATVLSFAQDKILKGAGGAVLFNDRALAQAAARVARSLPAPAPGHVLRHLALSLRNYSHSLYDLLRVRPELDLSAGYAPALDQYRDLILRMGKSVDAAGIADQMDNIAGDTRHRMEIYTHYARNIRNPKITVVELSPASTCWRIPLIGKDFRFTSGLTDSLRKHGVKASNHYFPLDILLGAPHKRSGVYARRLLNLWTDPDTTLDDADQAIRIINTYQS